ncbi:DUF454 domain-containing protein [Paracoccus aurantiacus]|uniref:DUF454 domain-containing protein n=1 Tax=Paracoccus aurantiacus TaxID=2599412 RepID=A0A5C6RYU4_9RHOB|nr:YbaN family protein [Paracoccus aurantiacus]TXB67786.1 DUF454 domain-containing protein [Paracoccus aurantiacus]
MRLIYLTIGWIAVGCAVVGAVLPIVPTVPFLLVALWAFSRSSERLRQRLLADPTFGPDIRHWQERGAIRRPAKVMAIVAMAGSVAIGLLMHLPALAITAQAIVLSAVSLFIVTRPET